MDGALTAARNVCASIGLLCDLYGELGAARGDGEAERLSRALDVIQNEAERVAECIAVTMETPFNPATAGRRRT